MIENEVSSKTQWNAAKNYKNYDMKCLWENDRKTHKLWEKPQPAEKEV